MLKVKAGDLDRMGLLFERYNRPLFGFFYHLTGERFASEDMTQNVFYRMIKYRHTFTGEGEFRTWMYHLARNVLIDSAKKNNKIVYQSDITKAAENYNSEHKLEKNLEQSESVELLHKALNKISADCREVLIMSKFQELPYKEIASLLKISEGNVKVKVYRALQELRKEFLKYS